MSRPPTAELAARLRHHAGRHPTLLLLKRDLPQLPKDASVDPGLYVETTETPGLVVNGELRVSIARIYTVTDQGRTLIGQVQATRVMDHPLKQWQLRMYVHVPKFFSTVRVEDVNEWWLQVLELHYRDGGGEVDLAAEHAVEA